MTQRWIPWLERAARMALRGHGNTEPNPMVGCVILDSDGAFAGEGYHRKCGGPHAEIEALSRAGNRARGGTAIVTLEPCNHHGRTGPCSDALVAAGISRVVYACEEPFVMAAGGDACLRAHGVEVLKVSCKAAERVTEPFLYSVRTGLPWVTMKWAQTRAGHISTQPGEDRWISGERSRAMVHRERGRVDAILTGMGTVLADDPMLTARNVHARRTPMRVVWDPRLELPLNSKLVRTARDVPLVVATLLDCAPSARGDSRIDRGHSVRAGDRALRARALTDAGASVLMAADLRTMLTMLRAERGVSTVLVEAGTGLVRALLSDGLVNEAWIFVAIPQGSTDDAVSALGCMGPSPAFELMSQRRRGADLLLHYRLPM